MEADTVAPATPTETSAPPVESTPEPSAEPSIAEHEAQFGRDKTEPATEVQAEPKRRHRQKDIATPGDVPRINELTKKLRDAERERDEWKTKASTPAPAAAPTPVRETAPAPAASPSPTGKPRLKEFEDQIGTKFDTYAEAVEAYGDARDDWKDAQTKQAAQVKEFEQTEQQLVNTYVERVQEFAKTTPDFYEKSGVLANASPLLTVAIVGHDNGPEIAYYLATHPDVLDDLSLTTFHQPINAQSVALLQRRLNHFHGLTAPTASVPAAPRVIAPRPPNAVRTGALKTTDEPPGDDASISEHEKYYGQKRRR